MIGRTFSTPSPGSRASVSPGRSSPIAAMTVWCVPLITWGVRPSEAMWPTMCSTCSAVASAFMTTITVTRPPSSGPSWPARSIGNAWIATRIKEKA